MGILRFLLTTILLILLIFTGRAQQTDSLSPRYRLQPDRYLALMTGLSAGSYVNGEIGLGEIIDSRTGIHPASLAWFASDEIRLTNKLLMGPKIGVWVAGGSALGLNMIYYTDFGKGTLVFRPEIGGGLFNVKLVYGYNAKLTNTDFKGINRNLVQLVYGFKLRELKDQR